MLLDQIHKKIDDNALNQQKLMKIDLYLLRIGSNSDDRVKRALSVELLAWV